MNIFNINFKRTILSKNMIIAIILGLASIIVGIAMEPLKSALNLYLSNATDISEMQKISLIKNSFNKVTLWHFGNYVYSLIMPLICCIPFNALYIENKISGFNKYLIIRSNYKNYVISTISIAFICGFLVIFITSSIEYILILFTDSGVQFRSIFYENTFMSTLSNNNFNLFAFIYIIICSFMGGIYSLIGLALSTITNNKLIAIASPFIIYYMGSYLTSSLQSIYFNPTLVNTFYEYKGISGIHILIQLSLLFIISLLIFLYKTYWSDCFD